MRLATRSPRFLRVAVSLLCFAGAASTGCRPSEPPARQTPILILTGSADGVYHPLGHALADMYSSRLRSVKASAEATTGSLYNVWAVQYGKADLAFAVGSVVYRAYAEGTDTHPVPHTRLRGIAVLNPSALQVAILRDADIGSVADLKGKRVAFGARVGGPVRGPALDVVIKALALGRARLEKEFLTYGDLTAALLSRRIDAGIFIAGYPLAAITNMASTAPVRLVDIDRPSIARMRSEYPYFRPVVIPREVYPDQKADVNTIGLDNLLICRADLEEELVYGLTRAFFESLPRLKKLHLAAEGIHDEQGPITPVPLHPGAALYYRERELLGL